MLHCRRWPRRHDVGISAGARRCRNAGAGEACRLLPGFSWRHGASLHASGDGRTRPDRRVPETSAPATAKDGREIRRSFDSNRGSQSSQGQLPLHCLHAAMGLSQFPARESGKRFSSLKVLMNAEATDLVWSDGAVVGVQAMTPDGPVEMRADLTIGCDGRHSMVRERAGLEVEEIGAPMDVLWFRVSKGEESESVFARVEVGKMMVTFDRGDYWQCAYVIAKGQYGAVKARGLDAFRDDVISMAPILKSGISDVKTWDDVKLLTVAINRLKRWTRAGLLCIGDAAHAMSPVGGVGVNLAVQDAVATANLLAAKLAIGCPDENELDAVRRRREFPTRMTQTMQVVAQNKIISVALDSANRDLRVPLAVQLINALPWLQGVTARFVALGVRPEQVHSPALPGMSSSS